MEQFIKSLENLDQETSFQVEQDGYQIGISLTLKATKGDFTQNFNYNCDIHTLIYEGYYGVDIHDSYLQQAYIGGLKIDNLDNLKARLTEWGFKGMADKLEISEAECDEMLYRGVSELPIVKTLFKGLKLFNTLPLKEKVILRLKHSIKLDAPHIYLSRDEQKLMPTDFAMKYEKRTLSIQDLKDWLNELEG